MAISVTTPATTRRLTRVEHVLAEIAIPPTDHELIASLIDQASAAIERHCQRTFGREVVLETARAYGDNHLQLSRTPIVAVASVLFDGTDVILDYLVEDRDAGLLYRRAGWLSTASFHPGLTGRQRWPGWGHPLPDSEEARFSATYTGGYILPSQSLDGVISVSAVASDSSFNAVAAAPFPRLVQAGDVIETRGFTHAENNGRFIVTGTPTAAKIQVSGTLVDEAAGASVYVAFGPPAGCKGLEDVEKATIETVKVWYKRRADAETIQERIGDLEVRRDPRATSAALPALAAALLAPWVRRVAA